MSDDDDWDSVPVVLNKSALKKEEEVERVQLEEIVKSTETSKPRNPVDEKAALAKANALSKAKQREREEEMARQAEASRNARPLTAEERASEALRLRRLQEESDAELVKDLFGGGGAATAASSEPAFTASAAQARARDGVQDLDSLISLFDSIELTNPRQNLELGQAIVKRLEKNGKKAVLNFLKEFLRTATEPISEEETNELIGILTVIKSEKLKARNAKKKAAQAPKPKLNTSGLDKPGGDRYDMDDIDDRAGRGKGFKNPYDDEDDFM